MKISHVDMSELKMSVIQKDTMEIRIVSSQALKTAVEDAGEEN